MRFAIAHINPDTTALYNVVETKNPLLIFLVYTYLTDNYKYSFTSGNYLEFHNSIEEAVAAAKYFKKKRGGEIMENVNCTVPRLRPKSTSAFTTTTLIACFAAVFLLLATPALASPTAHSYKRALSAGGYDDHDVGLHGFEFIRQHSQSLHANGIPSFNTTADVDENESGLEKRIAWSGYVGLGLFLRGVAWAVSEIFSGAICRWLGSSGALNTGGEVACWIAPPLLVLL